MNEENMNYGDETEPAEPMPYRCGAIRPTEAELAGIPPAPRLVYRTALPDSIDLSSDFPPAGHQGNQGSCAAWAIAYALKTYQEQVERRWGVDVTTHQFSPAFIYNLRYGENPGSNEEDKGMSVSLGMDIVKNKGVCTLADMPYNQYNHTTRPNAAQQASARKYRSHSYYMIPGNDVSMIKSYLYNGNPIIFQLPVYPDFDAIKASNPVYDSLSGTYRGDHAICIVGYDDNFVHGTTRGAFKFINSWGIRGINSQWGIGGYGYIAYNLIKNNPSEFWSWVFYDKIDVRSMSFSGSSIEIPIGESQTLTPVILPANATNREVSYVSDNHNIVTVSGNGNVYAAAIGQTMIRAESKDPDSNASAACLVKVKDAKLLLNKTNMQMYIGEHQILTKTVTPSNNITNSVTWNSSNPAVAGINSTTGTVSAISPGVTAITVKCNYPDSNALASCHVKVKDINDSLFISDTIPDKMSAGKTYHVTITLRNTGIVNWTAGQAGGFGYCLGNDVNENPSGALFFGGAGRIALPSGTVVRPGEVYMFNLQMKAPAQTGSYKLYFKMVNADSAWFGSVLSRKIAVFDSDAEFNIYGLCAAFTHRQLCCHTHNAIRNERFWTKYNSYGSAGTFRQGHLSNFSHREIRNEKLRRQHLKLQDYLYSDLQPYTQNQLIGNC